MEGTYPESLKRSRVSQQDTKPLIYIAVDDHATGFFTDKLKNFLINTILSALEQKMGEISNFASDCMKILLKYYSSM